MTRRLVIAILVMVWATLIAGGIVAYVTTRSVMLADLDAALVRRARALPELSEMAEAAPRMEESAGDRYVISNHLGQTRGRLAENNAGAPMPVVMHAALAMLGDGRPVRTLELRFNPRDGGQAVTVVYSGSTARFARVLNRLAMALGIFGVATGIGAAAVAVAVSRAALRPLRATAEGIGAIDERRLDRRIDVEALPPELHAVAGRLNEMLQRLQRAFAQRKQFLADAGHELRTPVAALVVTLEVALRHPRDAGELTRVLKSCLSDARMLRQLVQALLEHARTEAGAHASKPVLIDAISLLEQCCDVADGLALEKNVRIIRVIPLALQVRTDPGRLRGIVMNLLGNAVEYNHPGGTVELRAQAQGGDFTLVVSDSGPGIAPEHVPHVFEPFYRGQRTGDEKSGDVQSHHLGLGLFLVDSHVKALGGECRIESEKGTGTNVHVRLPGAVVERAVLEAASV